MRLSTISLIAVTLAASVGASGCGRSDLGRSPSQVAIDFLEGASGAEPDKFGTFLYSDVITYVNQTVNGQQVKVPTIFSDMGRVQLRIFLRDAGSLSPSQPTSVNGITFTRYRVTYRRADGRNTPGVDVPYPFDSAFTMTVQGNSGAQAAFEIVRHVAKQEAPLAGLASRALPPIGQPQAVGGQPVISTIAEVQFFGKDLAGNDVIATGSIGINFGDFGDPE